MGIRRGEADRECAWARGSDPGDERGIRCDEQGAEEAGIHFRRIDDLLRIHAGYGHGERPCAGMFLREAEKAFAPVMNKGFGEYCQGRGILF
jgi:hypothetical protein